LSDLHYVQMNARIEAALESREIFDPSSLDRSPSPWAGLERLEEIDALAASYVSDEDLEKADEVSMAGRRVNPHMPYEPIP